MFIYQEKNTYFAQVPGKTEQLCTDELQQLGAKNINIVYRGIYFEADITAIYRINYTSRIISRVLAPLVSFPCHNTDAIIKQAAKVKWEELLSPDKTFAISASVAKSRITNSLYAVQVLKDGIADYFRNKYGKRPSVNTTNPDLRLNLHIEKDAALISLDTSGESLHKRGYRLLAGEAPMQETVAAAIIKLSGWDGSTPLLDPMCGSGTILCEALMHYCRIPAQVLRKNFGFFNMPEFDNDLWTSIKNEYDGMMRSLPQGLISGGDKSSEAFDVCCANLSRLPYGGKVKLSRTHFQRINGFENGTIITNPPYGMRLGKMEEVQGLYKELGDFIKQKCKGTTAFIYTGEPSLRKHIGLKTSKRTPLVNGILEGVLLQIDSYGGSKKKQYNDDSEVKSEQ